MSGRVPHGARAPAEYRYALDAALTLLPPAPAVCCEALALVAELAQRLPAGPADGTAGVLWVEPQCATWPAMLAEVVAPLAAGGVLVVVAARPPACLLPERWGWGDRPLGRRPLGLARLVRRLTAAGLRPCARYGVHTAPVVGLGLLARLADAAGRPDRADRLRATARLRYCTAGPGAALSTVALLALRKEHA